MKMTHTHTKDECLEALVSAIFAIIGELAEINQTLRKINENMPVGVEVK